MIEQKKTNGSLALGPAPQVITIPADSGIRERRLRVAAYARVSSNSEDQLNSFAAQNAYYTDLISSNPDWDFVDVYADKGITGTSAEKRDDFQRLLADCRRGRIDKILTKSSSRFARNTLESLKAVRELKALNIGVVFEEQGIDTSELSGELLTTIFAMLAQQESESISEHMRRSYQMRMQTGTYLPNSTAFGYRVVGRNVEINPDEAQVVREIFQDYLAGASMADIAKKLNTDQVCHSCRKKWHLQSVSYILTNERYIGDSLWQKTYMSSELPRKHRRNNDQKSKYYATGTHPAIIDPDTFTRVQDLLQNRRSVFSQEQPKVDYPFRKMLTCRECGKSLRRKVIRGIIYWCCPTHDKDANLCLIAPTPVLQAPAPGQTSSHPTAGRPADSQKRQTALEFGYR